MIDQNVLDDGHCYACGQLNEDGLQLRFVAQSDSSVLCNVMLPAKYQGWRGVAHGGIVMTLLDEAMAHAAGARGERGVTASMSTRFRAPVLLEAPLAVRGRVVWHRRNVLGCEAEILAADGSVMASAEGNFVSRGKIDGASLASGFGELG